jgi:hypothetical protein
MKEERKKEIIDVDLDMINLMKILQEGKDTSALFIRASGEAEDNGCVMICGEHNQMVGAIVDSILSEESGMLKRTIFDAIVNYLSWEGNEHELVQFMEYIDDCRTENV